MSILLQQTRTIIISKNALKLKRIEEKNAIVDAAAAAAVCVIVRLWTASWRVSDCGLLLIV